MWEKITSMIGEVPFLHSRIIKMKYLKCQDQFVTRIKIMSGIHSFVHYYMKTFPMMEVIWIVLLFRNCPI